MNALLVTNTSVMPSTFWLDKSLSRCVWAETYYQLHRQKNQSHASALRRLANRWLKIIYKMWLDRSPYDAELRHRNQLKHGSWILQLKQP
jgi:hypothetical protein